MTGIDDLPTPEIPAPAQRSPAHVAFDEGDWLRAGRLARAEATDPSNPEAQAAAQALLRALDPDPWVVRIAAAAVGLLIIVGVTYLM